MFRIPRSLVLQVLPLAVIILIAAIDAGSNRYYGSDEKPFLWLALCLLSVWLWLQWPRPRNVLLWFAATLLLILLPSLVNSVVKLSTPTPFAIQSVVNDLYKLASVISTSSTVVILLRFCFRFRLVDRRFPVDARKDQSNAFSIFDIMAMCTAFATTTAAIRRGLTNDPTWLDWEPLQLALVVSCVTAMTVAVLRVAAFGNWSRSLAALAIALLPLSLVFYLATTVIRQFFYLLRSSYRDGWESVIAKFINELSDGYFFYNWASLVAFGLLFILFLSSFALLLRGCGIYLGTEDHFLSRFSWSRPAKVLKAVLVVLAIIAFTFQAFGQAGTLDDNQRLTYAERGWPWVFTAEFTTNPASLPLEPDFWSWPAIVGDGLILVIMVWGFCWWLPKISGRTYGKIIETQAISIDWKRRTFSGVRSAQFAATFLAFPLLLVCSFLLPLWISEQPGDPHELASNMDWGEVESLQERLFPQLLNMGRPTPTCLTRVSIYFDATSSWSREKLLAGIISAPWLQSISIEGITLSPTEQRRIFEKRRLRILILSDSAVTPAVIDDLANQSLLHELHIKSETGISSETVAKFDHLKSLSCSMNLSQIQLKLPPKLEALHLECTGACSGIVLSDAAHLTEVNLSQIPIEPRDSAHAANLRVTLRNLPLLQSINESGSRLVELEANATPRLNAIRCLSRDGSASEFGLAKVSVTDCDENLAIAVYGNSFPLVELPAKLRSLDVQLYYDRFGIKAAEAIEHSLACLPHDKVNFLGIDTGVINTDAALAIQKCRQLAVLHLGATRIAKADLAAIGGESLRDLEVRRCAVDQTTFEQILQRSPHLESLVMSASEPLDIDLSGQAALTHVSIFGVAEHHSIRLGSAGLQALLLADVEGERPTWGGQKFDVSGAAVNRHVVHSVCQHEQPDIRTCGSSLSAADWQGLDFKSCQHLALENERIGIAELRGLRFDGKTTSDSLRVLELHAIDAKPAEILEWVSNCFPGLKELRLDVSPWDKEELLDGSALLTQQASDPFGHGQCGLSIRGLSIDQETADAMGKISRLEMIDMRNCEIDDKAIPAFAKLTDGVGICLAGAHYDASRLAEVLAKREDLRIEIGDDPLPEPLRGCGQVLGRKDEPQE